MSNREVGQCIVSLCDVMEMTLKLLQEVGPSALGTAAALQDHDPKFGDTYMAHREAVRGLGGFRSLQDGLHLLAQIKQQGIDLQGAS